VSHSTEAARNPGSHSASTSEAWQWARGPTPAPGEATPAEARGAQEPPGLRGGAHPRVTHTLRTPARLPSHTHSPPATPTSQTAVSGGPRLGLPRDAAWPPLGSLSASTAALSHTHPRMSPRASRPEDRGPAPGRHHRDAGSRPERHLRATRAESMPGCPPDSEGRDGVSRPRTVPWVHPRSSTKQPLGRQVRRGRRRVGLRLSNLRVRFLA
jgi:hypothetical protein